MTMYIARTLDGDTDPLPASELRKMAREGTLQREDMVRRADDTKWHRASTVNGLFAAAIQPTPEPAPVPVAVEPRSGPVVEYVERPSRVPSVVTVEVKRRGNSLGVVALILGAIAFLICWVPLLGALGIPLSALGLILGLIGLLVAVARKGSGIGYPIAGTAISLVALVVAVTMTSAVVSGVKSAVDDMNKSLAGGGGAATGDVADVRIDRDSADGDGSPQPDRRAVADDAEAVTWAGVTDVVNVGDVAVWFDGAEIAPVRIRSGLGGQDYYTKEKYLQVHLGIANKSDVKIVKYISFGTTGFRSSYATLRDEFDNDYPSTFGSAVSDVVGRTNVASIRPGASIRDVLIFDIPVDAATSLRLELDAVCCGGRGTIRFGIPTTAIAHG